MYPCVLRAADAGQRRRPLRRRDRPPRPARDQHRSALAGAGAAGRRAEAICLVDGFPLPRCAVPHRRGGRGRRAPAPRSPPPRSSPRSPATATCASAAAQHPGWGFEEHVGYSTPEHREAIERDRDLAAAPPLVPVGGLLAARAGLARSERALDVLDVDGAAGAVEGDADGVEADLGVGRAGRGARPSRRWRGGGPALLAGVDREDRALGAEGGARRGRP